MPHQITGDLSRIGFAMNLTPQQRSLLAAVSTFEGIGRYQGLMPGKHLLASGADEVLRLQQLGLIEQVEITYNCGKTLTGVRLTPQGRLELEPQPDTTDHTPDDLALEHLLLLQDVLHFSRMPRYRYMLPTKKAQRYAQDDLDDLLARGYLLKLKVATDSRGAAKGYVISAKGKNALVKAGLE